MLTRETYIYEIESRLSWFESTVRIRNSLNLYDIDIHAESFFCELLNLAFGYKLENLNHHQTNFDSIDLGDRANRIAIQITAQSTRAKVQGTLDKFSKNEHEKEYDRLIVLIIGTKPKFRKPFSVKDKFCVDANTDVWDTRYLIKKISEKSDRELSQICDFFMEQLRPNEGYVGSDLNRHCAQMLSEMYSMCKAKLLSVGITEEIADKIIAADIESTKYQYILDEVMAGKRYLIGEFGSGKSHAMLVIAQRLMSEHLSDNTAVFPLYIQGKEIARIGSIKQWMEDKKYNKVNYLLLIDGLDEIERSLAGHLIEEINVLSVQYPENRILVASRPLTILSAKVEAEFNIRSLTDEECFSLYNIVSDSEYGENAFRWISENMRKTLSKPFFCIIFALFKSEPKGWAKNDIDLITALVTNSMQKTELYVETVFTDLANIAAKAIDRNYGDVHISEIHFSGGVENVLKTGFISLTNDYVSFPLPIIAQWMAAEAIRRGIVNIDDIISNNRRMSKWLYSLSILFSRISFDESLDSFSRIVQKSPGIASRIIRDGIRFDTLASFPDAYECGEKLQQTMQIWADALGSLSDWIAPLNHGKIRPLGININKNVIVYSWMRVSDDTRSVQVLPFDEMSKRGGSIYSRSVPAQATWPWLITFDHLADNLKEAIQSHTIIPNEGQLQEEYLWDILLCISGNGSLHKGKIDLTEFEQYRQFIGHRWQVNGKVVSADFLFYLLDKHIETGDIVITAPYPTSDKPNKAGWVWSGYSSEHFLKKTKFIYSLAIDEYMKMANSVFKKLQNSLRTAILSPCKLVGRLKFSETGVTLSDAPRLTWYIEALPKNEQTCVDIQLGAIPLNHVDLLDSLLQNNLRLRPDAESRGIAHITSGYLDIYGSTPVTDLVFSWLEKDLKDIGWIE